MNFIILMAVREIRASWRRLLFFFVCVAIGVGAIVMLRSIIQTVRGGLARESRAMLAADVAIGTNRPWTPDLLADLQKRLDEAPVRARQETIDVATMVRPAEGEGAAVARMVELRGVEPGFPPRASITPLPVILSLVIQIDPPAPPPQLLFGSPPFARIDPSTCSDFAITRSRPPPANPLQ